MDICIGLLSVDGEGVVRFVIACGDDMVEYVRKGMNGGWGSELRHREYEEKDASKNSCSCGLYRSQGK